MGNHVHLIAAPREDSGLAQALGRTHGDYARWLNLKRGEVGHVWQNRFYSCVLDHRRQWDALRYVELNPVRAGLADRAWEWPWSSACAHVLGAGDGGILELSEWEERWEARSWRDVLEQGVEEAAVLARIREAMQTGRPMAEPDFIMELESQLKRPLRPQKRGPRPKASNAIAQFSFGI